MGLLRLGSAAEGAIYSIWSPEELQEKLSPLRCQYHYSHALDILRQMPDGSAGVVSAAEKLDPSALYQLDCGELPFVKQPSRGRPT